jgi:toxin ParE1/3/4
MRAVKKLRAVEADISATAEWYERQCPGLGGEFIDAVQSVDALLLANPLRYSFSFADVRRLNLARFPYAIFYFIDQDTVVILGVLHHRRDTRIILQTRRRVE